MGRLNPRPQLEWGAVATALGPYLVAWTARGLVASGDLDEAGLLDRLAGRFPRLEPSPAVVPASLAGWLRGALAGADVAAPAVDLRGLPLFDARVYEAVRAIPRGTTATYGEIARLVGSPRAARAVGGALSRCPLFPAVPCHRVVLAADGAGGWRGDIRLKRRLLAAEQSRDVPRPAENGQAGETPRSSDA